MKRLFLSFCAIAAFTFYSCDSTKTNQENQTTATDESATTENTISIAPVTDFPEYNDAMLDMNVPIDGAQLPSDSISFSYNVKNFELGAQTDNNEMNLANSGDGQHIHLIFNNQPYHAKYTPEFKMKLDEGHYVALSFLSRSYHMSVKNPDAYVLRQFTVGDAEAEDIDLSGPLMFYSRPKGDYSGADTENLLLDFYLVNTELSENGNKVRATINGQEFILTDWQPYAIQGLPLGEVTIKLELIDADGNVIDGPYNTVERTVTLKE